MQGRNMYSKRIRAKEERWDFKFDDKEIIHKKSFATAQFID